MKRPVIFWIVGLVAVAIGLYAFVLRDSGSTSATISKDKDTVLDPEKKGQPANRVISSITLDTALYNEKLTRITNGDSSGKWHV